MKILGDAQISLTVTMEMSEATARALAHIAQWDVDVLAKKLVEVAGPSALTHERELARAFHDFKMQLPPILRRLDAARTSFKEKTDLVPTG